MSFLVIKKIKTTVYYSCFCVVSALIFIYVKKSGKFETNVSQPVQNEERQNRELLQDITSAVSQNLTTDDSFKLAPNTPQLLDARRFLEATPDTDDILAVLPAQYLKGVKSPCFALTNNSVNVGNINVTVAIERGYQIKCLPYFYIAGFTKCGTTDLYTKLSQHRLIAGGLRKLPTPSGEWKEKSMKEAHFWDNMYLRENNTINAYSELYSSERIVSSFKKYGSVSNLDEQTDDFRNLVYVDATPRTIWHGDTWDEDFFNMALSEPDILLPHKLYHVNPKAKIIVTLRNPTARLLSDYKFYGRGPKAAEAFHSKVVDAISWWQNCTRIKYRNLKACAYGKAPKGLPELGFEICMRNKTMTRNMRRLPYETGDVCQSKNGWKQNAADRLRVSMYHLFISNWLETFPRENFLFIKFEDWIKEPYAYIDRHVLPFLGLPPFANDVNASLASKILNQSKSTINLLPETKALLDQFFLKSKSILAELLNDDKFLWND